MMQVTSRARRSLWVLIPALGIFIITACSRSNDVSLDIESGHASYTLKEFARQANVEIVYDVANIENIVTNKVSGSMDPESGLTTMLRGTLLVLEKDPKTGAFAVKKKE